MILYHASYKTVSSPSAGYGRKLVDFGQGFYLTALYEQAVAWAQITAFKHNSYTPTVNTFLLDDIILDDTVLNSNLYRVKSFPEYDFEWLDYVVDCRRGGKLQEQYDIVEGGVANDNVIDTVELYEKGIITAEQAIGQLRYKKVNHQLCIHSQEIIDNFLHFDSSVRVGSIN
mgnify:CR=1 FL=1